MQINSTQFKTKAHAALTNQTLQQALGKLKTGFVQGRLAAITKLPEFDQIRDQAVEIKNHTLQNLDYYLEQFEKQVIQHGGHVHWALDAKEACQHVIDICQSVNAKRVIKSKSMVTEEINLNVELEKVGLPIIETDLGEYIIQKRHETPSHIVLPALHLLKEQIADTFYRAHHNLDSARILAEAPALLLEARKILRQQFLSAEVGITGANFLIAETGTTVMVTNEGNGELTQTLPKTYIVIASIEKILPTFEDAAQMIRLLSRSATGQEMTAYTTFFTGPKQQDEVDGPKQYHVILVDNGRSQMLGGAFQDMLRCIRCGACLNHCPVYDAVGGQAYGSMYSGPMGAVLTPSLFGIKVSRDLPNASTFCGRCEAVCPLQIPLPNMMRYYRELEFKQHLSSSYTRWGLTSWAFIAKRPKLYHTVLKWVAMLLNKMSRGRGRFHHLLFAKAWTQYRDFPAPAKKTFQQLWIQRQKKGAHHA